MTTDDTLLAAILDRGDRLRADDRHRHTTPGGRAVLLAAAAEKVAHFTVARDEAAERANLAEIRGTVVHAAALAVIVAQMADEARKGER